ncbi:MAG: orotidine-5'-phosphate decarboxylase [Ilumatobacteraceae bacterium]
MNFADHLAASWAQTGSALCVGLDPDPARLPVHLRREPGAIYRFCTEIVDATADLACSVKPQIAYFAAAGEEATLERICEYVLTTHPHLVLVLDAKRGDIGSTAEQYAREAYERYGAHAVTVNPYLGTDSIEPFLAHTDRGVFVLCRTSNPGGDDLQQLELAGGARLYEHVAELVATRWNAESQCGLVVGATYPDELERVRTIVGDRVPLLVPGVGAQGGDPVETVRRGASSDGTGLLVNTSRAVLYASSGEDFAGAARSVAARTAESLRSGRLG